jgi:hypothetical protein
MSAHERDWSPMASVCSRRIVTGERCEGQDGTRRSLLTGACLENTHEATSASARPGTLWTGPQLERPWPCGLVARREVGLGRSAACCAPQSL